MTTQPLSPDPHYPWAPNPVRQRLADYTVEDVLALPDDSPRVELSDGVMIVVPSPTFDHQDIAGLLYYWLRQHAPTGMKAGQAVGVLIDAKQTFEPDVLLTRGPVPGGRHYVPAEDVLLAVEVVSPGTRRRDRFEKPGGYAAAGIPFYWRIEQNPVHVFAYQLGAGETYRLVADSDSELVLTEPFPSSLPIGAITP